MINNFDIYFIIKIAITMVSIILFFIIIKIKINKKTNKINIIGKNKNNIINNQIDGDISFINADK